MGAKGKFSSGCSLLPNDQLYHAADYLSIVHQAQEVNYVVQSWKGLPTKFDMYFNYGVINYNSKPHNHHRNSPETNESHISSQRVAQGIMLLR